MVNEDIQFLLLDLLPFFLSLVFFIQEVRIRDGLWQTLCLRLAVHRISHPKLTRVSSSIGAFTVEMYVAALFPFLRSARAFLAGADISIKPRSESVMMDRGLKEDPADGCLEAIVLRSTQFVRQVGFRDRIERNRFVSRGTAGAESGVD